MSLGVWICVAMVMATGGDDGHVTGCVDLCGSGDGNRW